MVYLQLWLTQGTDASMSVFFFRPKTFSCSTTCTAARRVDVVGLVGWKRTPAARSCPARRRRRLRLVCCLGYATDGACIFGDAHVEHGRVGLACLDAKRVCMESILLLLIFFFFSVFSLSRIAERDEVLVYVVVPRLWINLVQL